MNDINSMPALGVITRSALQHHLPETLLTYLCTMSTRCPWWSSGLYSEGCEVLAKPLPPTLVRASAWHL